MDVGGLCSRFFLALSDTAGFLYKTTDYYAPEYERCIVWNDCVLSIDWPLSGELHLSLKDVRCVEFYEAEFLKMNRFVEFVWYRTVAELRADISRAFLGIIWWIIEPVMYVAIFYLIFVFVLRHQGENYVSLLLAGLIFWKWFASTINNATTSITRNMVLIYQVYLPKVVFPIISLFTSSFKFIVVLLVFAMFLIFTGKSVTSAWFSDLFFLLIIQALFMLGLGMILAAIDPFFPDIKFVVDNGLMMLFFLSGIFFQFDSVPESLRIYFELNPIGVLIHNYREVLIFGRHVDWNGCWSLGILTVCFLLVGLTLLVKLDRVYAKRAFL